MRFGTDYTALWTLEHEEEHAASREAAHYLEQVEEAAHALGAEDMHGFLAEVHDDYTDLDEDWYDVEQTEEAPYDHRVLEDFDIRYGLDGGGRIHFEYDREAVPNQFRLRVKGDDVVREVVEDALDRDIRPTTKRLVADTLTGSWGREPCPHCDERDADSTAPIEPFEAGAAAVTVEDGRSFSGRELRHVRVDVETEEAALEYHLNGRGGMWMHLDVPARTAIVREDGCDLPVLEEMDAGVEPDTVPMRAATADVKNTPMGGSLHTVPVSAAFQPVQEDGTVRYRFGRVEDGATVYTRHYTPAPAAPADRISLLFDIVEAEAGLPVDATEEAFAEALNQAGLADPRRDGAFAGQSVRDYFGR